MPEPKYEFTVRAYVAGYAVQAPVTVNGTVDGTRGVVVAFFLNGEDRAKKLCAALNKTLRRHGK